MTTVGSWMKGNQGQSPLVTFFFAIFLVGGGVGIQHKEEALHIIKVLVILVVLLICLTVKLQ